MQHQEQDQEEDLLAPISVVEIDALALMKIISSDALVTGQLLGITNGTSVEITNAFPIPTDDDTAEYQITMLRSLREVNIDHNTVGWYQSTHQVSLSEIELMYNYQVSMQSVVVTVDNGIKAWRLSEEFMELFKERRFTLDAVQSTSLMVEIPILVKHSALSAAYLSSLNVPAVSRKSSLERNLEIMSECMESMSQDQYKFNRYLSQLSRHQALVNSALQKRRAENAKREANNEEPLPEDEVRAMYKVPNEPSRLDLLMILEQLKRVNERVEDECLTRLCEAQ